MPIRWLAHAFAKYTSQLLSNAYIGPYHVLAECRSRNDTNRLIATALSLVLLALAAIHVFWTIRGVSTLPASRHARWHARHLPGTRRG